MTTTINDRQIRTVQEVISPERAAEILSTHKNWRAIVKSKVAELSSEMRRGEWRITGEAIKFDWNGKLLDGQHRLKSCVDTGIPLETFVVYGLDPDSVNYMDNGLARGVKDIMAHKGIENASTVKLAVRAILDWKGSNYANSLKMAEVTRHQMTEFALQNNDRIQEAISIGDQIYIAIKAPKAMATAFAYLAGEISIEDRDAFCSSLIDGLGLEKGSPVYALRQWFINKAINKTKVRREDIARIFIKAWNAYRNGEEISNLRVDTAYKKVRGDKRPPLPDLI